MKVWLCLLCRKSDENREKLSGECCKAHVFAVEDIEKNDDGIVIGCRDPMRDTRLFREQR
jgi:hypothetical protein